MYMYRNRTARLAHFENNANSMNIFYIHSIFTDVLKGTVSVISFIFFSTTKHEILHIV